MDPREEGVALQYFVYGGLPHCPACQDRGRNCPVDCVFRAAYPLDLHEQFPLLKKFHGLAEVEKLLSEIPENHNRQSFLRNLITDAVARESCPRVGLVDMISALSGQIEFLQDSVRRHQKILHQQQQTAAYRTLMRSSIGPRLDHIIETINELRCETNRLQFEWLECVGIEREQLQKLRTTLSDPSMRPPTLSPRLQQVVDTLADIQAHLRDKRI